MKKQATWLYRVQDILCTSGYKGPEVEAWLVVVKKSYDMERSKCKLSVSHSVMSNSLRPQWTAAHQAPVSMRFSMQGYWSGLPFPSPYGAEGQN